MVSQIVFSNQMLWEVAWNGPKTVVLYGAFASYSVVDSQGWAVNGNDERQQATMQPTLQCPRVIGALTVEVVRLCG